LKKTSIQFNLFAVALALLGIVSGCEQRGVHYQGYYPIDSVVTAQIQFLTAAKASAVKIAKLGDKEETQTIKAADSTIWVNELEIFRELKTLNKPINQGIYTVENGVPDTKSNLTIKLITASVADKKHLPPVRSMKIYYHNTLKSIKRIEAQFNEINSLYSSERFLVMEFQDVNNKTVLSSYSVNGGQKMFLGDSVVYSVKGNISLQ